MSICHFAENGCAKYDEDLNGTENIAIIIDKKVPGKDL
jgi:hypothetical protein